jgi:diguanylate cyclase (GGDEF)-like protein/PAS domain S-box-containing protein
MSGYSRKELLGQNPKLLKSNRHNTEFYEKMWTQLKSTGHWKSEICNRKKDGSIIPLVANISAIYGKDKNIQYFVALYSDITKIKEQQQLLEHLAHYDPLTSLPNRLLLSDRMKQAIKHAQRNNIKDAVAFIDLDAFKAVNDQYGHETGDQLLIKLSKNISEVLRDGDTIARLGGDEFIAVIGDLEEYDDCLPIIERILSVAAEPIDIEGKVVHSSASIGIAFYPQEEEIDADQLFRQADQAMYQAKLSGKQRYYLFDSSHDRNIRQQHEGMEEIIKGLRNEEFELHYQPKVNMRSGEIIGFEALIRWYHPKKGLLMPNMFLPIIEGHIHSIEMGEWVIDRALKQLNEWQKNGFETSVSVNIGALQLQQSNFVQKLEKILKLYPHIDPKYLELEVLETSALEDIANVSDVIRKCRDMNIYFALDDFGTGYSSLTYLRRLEAKWLKIDQSFIRDMIQDSDDMIIVDGIIKLAEAFGRRVIAEGVETLKHGELLLNMGCEIAQGYAIARPIEPDKVIEWTNTWKPYLEWQGQK